MYQSKNNNGVTIAMMRAFVALSRTLNLSKACEDLGATRQTVRRHITDLEEILGEPLFEVVDRQYQLTTYGREILEEANALLMRIDMWAGQSALKKNTDQGLEKLEFTDSDGNRFLSQQHAVSQIALSGLPIMKKSFVAWAKAETQIEHSAMEEIRPYTVLYRKGPSGWVFVEIGEKSAYSKWFGWAWSRSAIGKLISDDNLPDEYDEFAGGAYTRIYNEGGARLDHVYAQLPKDGETLMPVTFQRLLLGGVFPDGTPGLILLGVLTEQVQIDALDVVDQPKLPTYLTSDVVPVSAA